MPRHLLQKLPCQGGLQIDEAGQRSAAVDRRIQVQLLHVQQLRLGTESLSIVVVAAHDDVVGIHLLGDAIDGRARRQNRRRNSRVVEGVIAIVAAGDIEVRRAHPLRQHFGERFSNPFQPRRAGLVLEGHDHQGLGAGKRLSASGNAGQAHKRQNQCEGVNDAQKKILQSSLIIDVTAR